MNKTKACMVTGHRKIEQCKIGFVKSELLRKIQEAIEDGYTHFISGFAEGVDIWFAEMVIELRESHNIKLAAVIPYRNRMNSKDVNFQRLIKKCDSVDVCTEIYTPACFMNRNRIMVKRSERVIAVFDGRENGGTLNTMSYAHALNKDIIVIDA